MEGGISASKEKIGDSEMEKIQRKTKIEKSIRFAKMNPDLFEGEAFDGRIDIKD